MQNSFKKIFLIIFVLFFSLLIALPRIPLVYSKIGLNSYIGGYTFALGNKIFDFSELKKGLDVKGGVSLLLEADMAPIALEERNNALESAKQIIINRIDLLGVAEPVVTTVVRDNSYRISVEIPGVYDINQAVQLLGQTAQLSFKQLSPEVEFSLDKDFSEYVYNPNFWIETNVTGKDLKGAEVVFSQNGTSNNAPQIQLKFSPEGRQKFSELLKSNINKPIGIFFDDMPFPISAPLVSEDLATGLVQDPVISGSFSYEYAKNLSIQLRAGALPVSVKLLEQKTIGAYLGEQEITKSFFAGTLGIILVLVLLIILYGKYGFISSLGMFYYAILNIALFKLVPVVLTLPGIAGFMLSVGMAADAHILIFERIKEEKRKGFPIKYAISKGFENAWASVKDSNVSSLITCFILYYFGTGSVRGFALTLALGILTSLFCSFVVMKALFNYFWKNKQ